MEDQPNDNRPSITDAIEALVNADRAERRTVKTPPAVVPQVIGALNPPNAVVGAIPRASDTRTEEATEPVSGTVIVTRMIVGGVATDVNLLKES